MYRVKVITLLLMSMYIIGCYTVIQHPTLSESVIQEKGFFDENVLYIDDCSRCHDSTHPFRSSYIGMYHSMPADHDFYRWQYFYDMTWWQEKDFYSPPPAMGDAEILPPTQKRDFTRRDEAVGNNTLSSPAGNTGPATLSKQANSTSSNPSSNSGESGSDKRDFSRRDSGNSSDSKPREKPQPSDAKTSTEKTE